MSTFEFGIAKPTGSQSEWLMQGETDNNTAQEALALDNDGEPVVAHYYQRIKEKSVEAIVPVGDDVPEVGKPFSWRGTYYYVASSTKTGSNTDFTKWSLTIKRFIKNNLPSGAEESSSGA